MPPYASVIITGVASAQASQSLGPIGAVPWPASASVAHLKVNGTAMVASLATKISTVANRTRAFKSAPVGRPDVGPQVEQRRE